MMHESTIQMVRNVARGMWWKLPAGHCREDIEQEALLGAMQAPEGCQVRAARWAVIEYLRKWHPGSRSGRQARYFQLDGEPVTRPTAASRRRRGVIDADERAKVMAAVDALPMEELEAIRALFYDGETQQQYARRCGRSVSSIQRVQYRALGRIRRRLAA